MNGDKEFILNEALNLLQQGKPVDFCVAQYPQFKEEIKIAYRAYSVPTLSPDLDQKKIWNKISRQIVATGLQQNTVAMHFLPFQGLRFTFTNALTVTISLIILVGLVNTTAIAAGNSLPGQTLYSVKRTAEKIELTLTLGENQKNEVLLKHAEHRLSEAKAIVETNTTQIPSKPLDQDEKSGIIQTLNDLNDTTTKLAEESNNKDILKKVVELSDKQESVLSDMENKVSGDTKAIVSSARDTAVETKSTAEKTLAKLEQDENTDVQGAATTSTPKIVPAGTDDAASDKSEKPTSTDPSVKSLGNPEATTTPEEVPQLHFESSTLTTTPDIIDLK